MHTLTELLSEYLNGRNHLGDGLYMSIIFRLIINKERMEAWSALIWNTITRGGRLFGYKDRLKTSLPAEILLACQI
jgi:hypothetical protein